MELLLFFSGKGKISTTSQLYKDRQLSIGMTLRKGRKPGSKTKQKPETDENMLCGRMEISEALLQMPPLSRSNIDDLVEEAYKGGVEDDSNTASE